MQKAAVLNKRPCRICRRWFLPNPRLKDRQMTCAHPECKREWHRRKCAEWNKNNSDYFSSNYLQKKLDDAAQCDKVSKTTQPKSKTLLPPKSRLKSGLPIEYVQEVIGIQHLVIMEYLAQLLLRRFQEVLRGQVVVNTGQVSQLPGAVFSRCDRL
jgi:hypothetical protein